MEQKWLDYLHLVLTNMPNFPNLVSEVETAARTETRFDQTGLPTR